MRLTRKSSPEKFSFIGGWLIVYLAIPFLALLVYVFKNGVGTSLGVASAAYVSAVTATITTLTLVLFGLPLASRLAHSTSTWSGVIKAFIRLPLGIPPLVSGVMLLIAFGPYSFIGRLFGGHLVNSMIAIVLAQLLVEMPFVVEGSRAALAQLEPEVYEVSRILGIPNSRRLVGVEIPLAMKTIRTSVMMGWLRAFGEFGATVLVAYHPTSLPVLIFTQFSGTGLSSAIMPVGAVLTLSFTGALVIGRIGVPSKSILGVPSNPEGQELASPMRYGLNADSTTLNGHKNDFMSFQVQGSIGDFNLLVVAQVSGKSLAITGPSGSGKSLTLRSIVGLMPSFLNDFNINGIENPRIAFVPQGQALFNHLDVFAQLAIAARWAGDLRSAEEIKARVYESASEVGILHLLDRDIPTLSGGQKQRVALARAIATRPDLLVLDEPFSALDRPERDRQIRFVRNLVKELGLFLIVVTHDIEEAAFLAEEISIIRGGSVVGQGSVARLLKQPTSTVVAEILGYENIIDLTSQRSGMSLVVDGTKLEDEGGGFIAFKSSGHSFREFFPTDATITECQFEWSKDEVVIRGVFDLHDVIDLGNEFVVILKYGTDSYLEFKTSTLDLSNKFGKRVNAVINLEPASTAYVPPQLNSVQS